MIGNSRYGLIEDHAMTNTIRDIGALGQAIWLDTISRELLRGGGLRTLIGEGVSGMTSNPTIFQKAISTGSEYDDEIAALTRRRLGAYEIYEALATADIRAAADQLRPVYNDTHGRDGYVSIEVSPTLAHQTQRTIDQALLLWRAIARPNLMIKVPATPEGLPAVRTLIGEGVNVNVTLIFSISVYERVMQAYLDGLRDLRCRGRPIGLVASVASFFVSRVDTLVDRLLEERIEDGDESLRPLLGRAAVANAKIAYARFRETFEGERFAELRAAGARVQRPLWASTGTKNPAYSSTLYVDALIGPDTVNTVPPATLEALREQARQPARTIDVDVESEFEIMQKLRAAGIDMDAVTQQLLSEGVRSFADSFDRLLADVEAKRTRFARVPAMA